MWFIPWLVLALIVAAIGSKRKIGFWKALLAAIFLSPLIGLIIVLVSEKLNNTPNTGTKTQRKSLNKNAIKFRNEAEKLYQSHEYLKALENLKEAISLDPNHPNDFFNLTCLYSLLNDKDKGFRFLQKAVELGYSNFEKIKTSKDLEFLRSQSEFEDFALNGYKFEN
jgi:tetratricopeptide (TPR) repeat protein